MAATRLMALHIAKGKSIAESLTSRLDYYKNKDKTEDGKLISTYECDKRTVVEEFMLSKNLYHKTKRAIRKNEIIAYQIRQSFKPGEITAEKANELGYELAMRFTKGKYAFAVYTHDDRKHIHNHIVFNSVSIDGKRKYKDYWRSGKTLQKVSDLICLENGLSVIEQRNKENWSRKKSKRKTFNIKDGEIKFLKDIEGKVLEGYGKGYINWAKKFNAKQLSKTILFLQEKGISSYEELKKYTDEKTGKKNELLDLLKEKEHILSKNKKLQCAIIDFAKTKPIYDEYKKRKFDKSFYEEHSGELMLYQNAIKVFDESGYKKLPKIKELREQYGQVLQEKKAVYEEYKQLEKEYREYQIAQKNLEMIYQLEDAKKDEQEKFKSSQTKSRC